MRYFGGDNVPVNYGPWFRQRLARGQQGGVRLFLANPQIAIRHPLFWVYGTLLVILASPLRWESVLQPGSRCWRRRLVLPAAAFFTFSTTINMPGLTVHSLVVVPLEVSASRGGNL